jgi:hypothetical protein
MAVTAPKNISDNSTVSPVKGFLRGQISYLLRMLPYQHTWRDKLSTVVEVVWLLVRYARLRIILRFSTGAESIRGKTCVAVLLSHNRPQNMSLLVESALRNRFVTTVIVSNSNPKVKIGDWITSKDSRLVIINETAPTQPGHRLVLAKQTGAEYILSIDDDIFLAPMQWKSLFEFLLADERSPHGIVGDLYCPEMEGSNGLLFNHVTGQDMEVDVLTGVYAFTSEHLKRVFELAAKIGVSDLSHLRNGEDILLSFSGKTRPHIHALKPALLCASGCLPGVALWKSDDGFWEERIRVFKNVRDANLGFVGDAESGH